MKSSRPSNILLFAVSILQSTFAETEKIVDPRPGFPTDDAEDEDNVFVQARIIGGTNAREDRYPYFVSMVDVTGRHTCGGSLIAPDIVLSAGHCQGATRRAHVGRWNRRDPGDDYEDIGIRFPEYPHPGYSDDGFPNDFLIIKLESQSTKPILRLNQNPALPRGNVADEVTVIGFGNTVSGVTSMSSVLKEAGLEYIPNSICELSKDPGLDLSYQNQIIDSMLCAGDEGEDSCQGDSGGPLIVSGGSATDDVLVGIISWGFGCALPEFPGVYSRVSAEIDWLKARICQLSDAPPDYLGCNGNSTVPPKSIPVTVSIQLDDFPEEISWAIVDRTDSTTYVEVPSGTYTDARSRIRETVFLPAGGDAAFWIEDSFGDGLCCNEPGNYFVTLGSRPNGKILASGGGKFGSIKTHDFDVPGDYKEMSDDDVPPIGAGEIPLTVLIQLDNNPQNIGWKIERLGIEVEPLLEIPAGIYKTPGATIVRTIVLEKNELYYFRVYDITSNGINGGFVKLFLGTAGIQDDSKVIYEAGGQFKGGVDHSFLATTDSQPTEEPRLEGDDYLTLQLYFDLYPGEVGIQLRANNAEMALERQTGENSVIFFRPPRYYKDFPDEVITERIPIPVPRLGSSREFTLIVTDSFSDGLCCNWNKTAQTGYTLYDGNPDNGDILVDSRFIGVAREVSLFVIEGRPSTNPDPAPLSPIKPVDLIDIKVTITLDSFPDEIGFYIEDETGYKVADFPAGTYKNLDDEIEEYFTIPAGIYTFTITDAYGDGINRDAAFYRIDIVGAPGRQAVLAGTGRFVSQKSHAFVLEGKSADYPMTIKFISDDKPEEFGFFVKRLDLLDTDAMVASVPQGSYQETGTSITETFKVKEGSLYRIIFEDAGKDGIGGVIDIIMGSDRADDFNAISYFVDGRELSAQQLKVYAGEPPTPGSHGISLDLQMTFDKFPHEVEWILVASNDPYFSKPSSQNVLAFGPYIPYDESLARREKVESIVIPNFSGEKSFSMIVTDSAGDGVCCTFGDGGPVKLYEGTVEDGALLFSEPFRGVDRLVQTFVLVGDASASFSKRIFPTMLVSLLASLFLLQ